MLLILDTQSIILNERKIIDIIRIIYIIKNINIRRFFHKDLNSLSNSTDF
jgi:hypothetical protein